MFVILSCSVRDFVRMSDILTKSLSAAAQACLDETAPPGAGLRGGRPGGELCLCLPGDRSERFGRLSSSHEPGGEK